MNIEPTISLPLAGHWTEGGTGVTNLSCNKDNRAEVYLQAAANIGYDGITVVNRDMDGTEGCSLHDCARRGDLSAFWDEVRRINGGAIA